MLWVPKYQHQFTLYPKVFELSGHSFFSNIQLAE